MPIFLFSPYIIIRSGYNISMTPKNIYFISAIIFLLGFIAGGVTFSALTVFSPGTPIFVPGATDGGGGTGTGTIGDIIHPEPGDGGGTVACTMDAKICPDGSAVGRVGPNCEFAECPSADGGQGTACRSDNDCSAGYVCLDPSPVVREGETNLRCWSKGMPTPICLSGDTRIETPDGKFSVKDMKTGMRVWTRDRNGKKVTGIVILAGKTFAPAGHKVVHIKLSDGRELYVSSGHKVADGRKSGELRAGDSLDGAIVLSANLIPYTEEYTYDILPSGDTGMYFANGILLRSTLSNR
jgi:hypothetical protein